MPGKHLLPIVLVLTTLKLFASEPFLPDTTKGSLADSTSFWKISGTSSLSFNQIAFSDWAIGGENSFSGKASADYRFNYKNGNRLLQNTVSLAFGQNWTEQNKFRKTVDKLNLNSLFGINAFQEWYYSFMMGVKTQFANGYKYPNDSTLISQFFSPAYISTSFGMEYKPFTCLSLFISPASGKFTVVLNQELADKGSYGVEPAEVDEETGEILEHGKRCKPELGVNLILNFSKEVMKNINVRSIFNLYNNYMDEEEKNRWNLDLDWETNIDFGINKYFSTIFYFHMIYDHDVIIGDFDYVDGKLTKIGEKGPRMQIQESFGVGLSVKL